MIPVRPNWQNIMRSLRATYRTDEDLLKALECLGCVPKRETLVSLRTGKHVQPRYSTGAALLNLARG